MKMELPELSKCCCCIPLLYGLIAWGYVKLALGGLSLFELTPIVISNIKSHDTYNADGTILQAYVLMVFVMLEVISSIMLLAGAHTKSVKILRSYKSYTKFLLGLFLFQFITEITFWISCYQDHIMASDFWFVLTIDFIVGFLYTVLQIYIILLASSEIKTLENYREITFASNTKADAALAKCALDMGNGMDY